MKIYVASKSQHADRWRAYRDVGIPISCTWIDEAGAGQTMDWGDLWNRCVEEASTADAFLLFRAESETLKGAYVELGAALAGDVPVWYVGDDDGNISKNPKILRAPTIDEGFCRILEYLGLDIPKVIDRAGVVRG